MAEIQLKVLAINRQRPEFADPSCELKGARHAIRWIVSHIGRRLRSLDDRPAMAGRADETCLGYEASWLQWQWRGSRAVAEAEKGEGGTGQTQRLPA